MHGRACQVLALSAFVFGFCKSLMGSSMQLIHDDRELASVLQHPRLALVSHSCACNREIDACLCNYINRTTSTWHTEQRCRSVIGFSVSLTDTVDIAWLPVLPSIVQHIQTSESIIIWSEVPHDTHHSRHHMHVAKGSILYRTKKCLFHQKSQTSSSCHFSADLITC